MYESHLRRFMKYIMKTDHCWIWTGAKLPRGYGRFYYRGKPRYAHRVSIEILGGQCPRDDQVVMHSCDNPQCVNPEHLSIGTQTDNMRDAAAKGRTVNVNDWSGNNNPKSKLSTDQVREIQRRLSLGERPVDLSIEFGVTRTRVSQLRPRPHAMV